MVRTTILRLVALTLLLFSGVELFACELIAPEYCQDFGSPDSPSDSLPSDHCVCCCVRVVIASPMPVFALEEQAAEFASVAAARSAWTVLPVYHPPKV